MKDTYDQLASQKFPVHTNNDYSLSGEMIHCTSSTPFSLNLPNEDSNIFRMCSQEGVFLDLDDGQQDIDLQGLLNSVKL